MKKASSLSELGFDPGEASSGFFRPVSDSRTPSAHRRSLTKVSVIGAGNVGMAIAQTILTRNLADEIALVDALPDELRGETLDLQRAAAFLPRTRLVSVTRGSNQAIVTAGARQIPGKTRLNLLQRIVAALFRPVTHGMDSTPTSHHHQRQRMAAHSILNKGMVACLCIALRSSTAAASRVLRTSSSIIAGTATAPFCGSASSCSAEDELKLREAFLKAHGYEDAGCRSDLKEYLCEICLPPAPAPVPERFSNTTASITNNSSLPLSCATASSVSIHDLTSSPSTQTPPTPDWLPADDDTKASSTTPKWLIGLLACVVSALAAIGGFVAYKVLKPRLKCCNNNNNNHCCTNISCCNCKVYATTRPAIRATCNS